MIGGYQNNMDETKVRIDMTEDEAKSFIAFRRYQDMFVPLLEAGVFNVRNGRAILNFNAEGHLTEVGFEIVSYKRGYPIVQVVKIV